MSQRIFFPMPSRAFLCSAVVAKRRWLSAPGLFYPTSPLQEHSGPSVFRQAVKKAHEDREATPCGCSSSPRLLFFGGDAVSVTALQALCARLTAIHTSMTPSSSLSTPQFIAQHLTVICPSLPPLVTPALAAERYSRQFPVVRFAVERGLPLFPVDHPKSLAKSALLKSILARDSEDSRVRAPNTNTPFPLLVDIDVALVVSFRYFLPQKLLRALPSPVLNMHPSFLPFFRGASPIFSTLLWHEEVVAQTRAQHDGAGVTIAELHSDQPVMDGGRVLWQRRLPLTPETDLRTYFPLATQVGAAGCCEVIFGGQGVTDQTIASAHRHYADRVAQERELHAWSAPLASSTTEDGEKRGSKRRHKAQSVSHEGCREEKWLALFPGALTAPHCDWPTGLQRYSAAAAEQVYPRYACFSDDPFHAPLLPKDAALIHFDEMTEREAFSVWRAFVGGACFTSTVNTHLLKTHSPVGEDLLLRATRRLLRDVLRLRAAKPIDPSATPVGLEDPTGALTTAGEGNGTEEEHENPLVGTGSCWPTLKFEAVLTSTDGHMNIPTLLKKAEVRGGLEQACSFTEAVHPDLVPAAVRHELAEVEALSTPHSPMVCPTSSSRFAFHLPHCTSTVLHRTASRNHFSFSFATRQREPVGPRHLHLKGDVKDLVRAMDSNAAHEPAALHPTPPLSPGSAYFPHADSSIGAIKCREGWFFWKAAHLTGSPTRSQPTALLRKGLAMRCGTVYVKLFASPASEATFWKKRKAAQRITAGMKQ